MAVDDTNTIDFIVVDRDGRLVLVISDHLEWDTGLEHLYLLQQKINAYLVYIQDGQLKSERPVDANRPTVIRVVAKYPMDESSEVMFARFRGAVVAEGYQLEFEHKQAGSSTN